MNIGSIALPNITVLAPLAGITNLPFRRVFKEAGCGLVYSEMISANGLVHQSPKTVQMLETTDAERPLAVQIFGSDPRIMADAAAMVEAAGADILDINFGCSVRKVVKTGAGVALMRAPERTADLLRAVRRAVAIPLTVKIRSGWDASGQQALQIARTAEDCGVEAIAVHPRTATQGFRGSADWKIIRAVKDAVSIPVIGNGDIASGDDAAAMIEQTGCDAVMVGRAAIGNPGIFPQMISRLENRPVAEWDTDARLAAMVRYLDLSIDTIGESHACRMMRSRLGWFVKGLPLSSRFRASIRQVADRQDTLAAIDRYREMLQRYREDHSSDESSREPKTATALTEYGENRNPEHEIRSHFE